MALDPAGIAEAGCAARTTATLPDEPELAKLRAPDFHAERGIELLRGVQAVELICAGAALDLRRPLQPAAGTAAAAPVASGSAWSAGQEKTRRPCQVDWTNGG